METTTAEKHENTILSTCIERAKAMEAPNVHKGINFQRFDANTNIYFFKTFTGTFGVMYKESETAFKVLRTWHKAQGKINVIEGVRYLVAFITYA